MKALCICHPDDDAAMWTVQGETVKRLLARARGGTGSSFCWRSFPRRSGPVDDDTTANGHPALLRPRRLSGRGGNWTTSRPNRLRADGRSRPSNATTPARGASWCWGSMLPEAALAACLQTRRAASRWSRASRWGGRYSPRNDGAPLMTADISDTEGRRDDGRGPTHGFAGSGTRRGRPRARQWHEREGRAMGGAA